MKVIGSVIARAGSKRLAYKNLLPYKGVPLVRHALLKLKKCDLFSQIILSTDCELIVRTCLDIDGVNFLRRPTELATDKIASVPVFQHIIKNFPCDIHLNYNCNFPECSEDIFSEAIELAKEHQESLSDPFAVWAQTSKRLGSYGDPHKIKAKIFSAKNVHPIDVHTHEDLLSVHQDHQPEIIW